MSTSRPVVALVGVGPGLGRALALRFAAEGTQLALLARSAHSRDPVIAEVTENGGVARGYACDVSQPGSVADAFAALRSDLGEPEVLIYNAGMFSIGGVLELSSEEFEQAWKINCMGAFLAAQQVLPAMLERGSGTLLFTGATAALRGGNRFSSLAVGKAGLRMLAQSLAREFGPQGIHAAHVIIDGQINSERTRQRDPSRGDDTYLDPAAIAESFWQIHQQPRSAWTQEMDLRPHIESF